MKDFSKQRWFIYGAAVMTLYFMVMIGLRGLL